MPLAQCEARRYGTERCGRWQHDDDDHTWTWEKKENDR